MSTLRVLVYFYPAIFCQSTLYLGTQLSEENIIQLRRSLKQWNAHGYTDYTIIYISLKNHSVEKITEAVKYT